MVDVFTREQRSKIMSAVKGRGNKGTELKLVKIFRKAQIIGWRRHRPVFGKPDFIFPAKRVAVFVDGCFWHGCPDHGMVPASNSEFWREKIERNRRRDKLVGKTLKMSGWRVVRIWQHELHDQKRVLRRISRSLFLGG